MNYRELIEKVRESYPHWDDEMMMNYFARCVSVIATEEQLKSIVS